MNKIRKYLIHLLGGVTEEECDVKVLYYSKKARVDEMKGFGQIMDSYYYQSSEEWCRNMYEYTCDKYKRAVKNLEALKQQMITTK